MVFAPEHPLVDKVTTPEQRAAVNAYRAEAARKANSSARPWRRKRPASLPGLRCQSVNNEKIPIWVADYVMMGTAPARSWPCPPMMNAIFEFAKNSDWR